jgi:hypothetical protein
MPPFEGLQKLRTLVLVTFCPIFHLTFDSPRIMILSCFLEKAWSQPFHTEFNTSFYMSSKDRELSWKGHGVALGVESTTNSCFL